MVLRARLDPSHAQLMNGDRFPSRDPRPPAPVHRRFGKS